jgi:hypothetical protein
MDDDSPTHHAHAPWSGPSSLQEDVPSAEPAQTRRLVPFLVGLGQSLLLVLIAGLLVFVLYELPFYFRYVIESIFVAVPGVFIVGLIMAIRLTRRPGERWVGLGFFAGLFLYLILSILFLLGLYILLTEL